MARSPGSAHAAMLSPAAERPGGVARNIFPPYTTASLVAKAAAMKGHLLDGSLLALHEDSLATLARMRELARSKAQTIKFDVSLARATVGAAEAVR